MVEKNPIGAACFTEKKGVIGLPIAVVLLSLPSFRGEKKQFVKAYRHNTLLAAYSVPARSECLLYKCLEEKSTYVGAHWYVKLP